MTNYRPQMSSSFSQGLSDPTGNRPSFQHVRTRSGNGILEEIGAISSPVIDLTASNDEDHREDLESHRPAKRLRLDAEFRHEPVFVSPEPQPQEVEDKELADAGDSDDDDSDDDDSDEGDDDEEDDSDDSDDSDVSDDSDNDVGSEGEEEEVGDAVHEPKTLSVKTAKPSATFREHLSHLSIAERAQQSQSTETQLPMPSQASPTNTLAQDTQESAAESEDEHEDMTVQITPYTLEKPDDATKLADQTVLDFHPWTGDHPEDELDDPSIKQGFFDRVQLSQNESSTARPVVYAHLKHPNGVKALSHLFAAALKRRQANLKIPPNSTFKPPPRVTLTDNKREAWLRDLANSSVPLRRLSRTIPHGVRGKILLDQCLGKSIPISRAIWLAKCVGANEIRAFKRKGTSTVIAIGLETKWVKDWTGSVQQFLEGVVHAQEEAGWIENQAYAMRLAGRLFLEQLLDQDSYLEWYLTSIQASSLDLLPVWLSTVDAYWPNLVSYRRRGRRVAHIFLDKLASALNANRSAALGPLITRLQTLIRSFAISNPSSFIAPLTWSQHQKPLATCFNSSEPVEANFLAQVAARNIKLTNLSAQAGSSPQKSAPRVVSQQLISLLDSACAGNTYPVLVAKCLALPLDHKTLVFSLLDWCSTPFRYGNARIFVSARLLWRWRKSSIDTDAHILSFLVENSNDTTRQFKNIYHLVSELVRAQSFSTGKYLEWLMARGAIQPLNTPGQLLTADVQLLQHIPSSWLPSHIRYLRNTLLVRAGLSIHDEARRICHIKATLQQKYPDIFNGKAGTSPNNMVDANFDWASLTWTVKSDVSHWLREQVTSKIKSQIQVQVSGKGPSEMVPRMLSLNQFYNIRGILEGMTDISILADILKFVSQSTDPFLLATATDTLNYHLSSFSAIGATTELFQSFALAYSKLSKTTAYLKDLVVALLDIAIYIPSEGTTVAVLRRDLARYEKKSAMAASSPVSEHMADTLNPVNPTFSGMLDQLLASGNCMDEATLVRVFDLLIQKLETGKADISLSSSEAARYLAQLRFFNTKGFDKLMIKRVATIVRSTSRPSLTQFLPPLVGVGCITLPAFFGLVKQVLKSEQEAGEDTPKVMQLRLDMLSVLCLEKLNGNTAPDLVFYRFKIAREEFILKNCRGIMNNIRDAIIDASTNQSCLDFPLQEHWNTSVFPLLCELLVRHASIAKDECVKWVAERFPANVRLLGQALDCLLSVGSYNLNDSDRVLPDSLHIQQQTLYIIQRIDDFSLPFCLIKLQLLLAGVDSADKENVLDPLFDAAEVDVKCGLSRWVDVLTVLDDESRRQIRQKVENKILSLFITSTCSDSPSPITDTDEESAPVEVGLVYLRIVEELTPNTLHENVNSAMGSALLERMNVLLQRTAHVTKAKAAETRPIVDAAYRAEAENLSVWIFILLRLVCLYRLSFNVDRGSKSDLTDQTRLLLSICYLTFTPALGQFLSHADEQLAIKSNQYQHLNTFLPDNWRALRTHAMDVAALLVDTIPDEARLQCVRFLRERSPLFLYQQQDLRLVYLFGPLPEYYSCPFTAPAGTTPSAPAPSQPPGSSPMNVASSSSQSQSSQTQPSHTTGSSIIIPEETASPVQNFRFQQAGRVVGPCPPRTWEMLEEAAPVMGVNDTALSLSYFGARQLNAGPT